MGDSTGYNVLLPGICKSYTYDNILRDKEFIVDENCHKLEYICGEHGFIYNIPSPQNPLTEERMPTAAASLTPFYIKE